MVEVELEVNGTPTSVQVRADRRLVDTLRDDLGMCDTKVSCEDGVCGVCTVVCDGRLVSACLTLTVQADGCDVWTAAGLATRPELAALRDAFDAEGGIQCGFCTNGQFVTAAALVDEDAEPVDSTDIVEHMRGTLCRCTGYFGILRAVERARR